MKGLSRDKKVKAIHKSLAASTGKIKRSIDEGKSKRHKTWEDRPQDELRENTSRKWTECRVEGWEG